MDIDDSMPYILLAGMGIVAGVIGVGLIGRFIVYNKERDNLIQKTGFLLDINKDGKVSDEENLDFYRVLMSGVTEDSLCYRTLCSTRFELAPNSDLRAYLSKKEIN